MSISFIRSVAFASAFCFVSVVSAQDDSDAAEGGQTAAAAPVAAKSSPKCFHTLVRLVRTDGEVFVKYPHQSGFVAADEGKFYPLGSYFRVNGGDKAETEFEFGEDVLLKASGPVEFAVAEPVPDKVNRTVIPMRGMFKVSLPRTFPTGCFSVAYPHFTAKDLAGESRHEIVPSGDGDEAVIHVVTGILALDGAHYSVARMNAADRIRIRTTRDALFTSLRGETGECKVALDKGTSAYRDPVSGEMKKQDNKLDFSLTPQRAIKIFRKRSEIGGRIAVSIMTFDSTGEMCNRYTFAEGEASMNFGEEIVRIQDISFKTDKKEQPKKESKKDDSTGGQSSENTETSTEGESSSSSSGNASGFDSASF